MRVKVYGTTIAKITKGLTISWVIFGGLMTYWVVNELYSSVYIGYSLIAISLLNVAKYFRSKLTDRGITYRGVSYRFNKCFIYDATGDRILLFSQMASLEKRIAKLNSNPNSPSVILLEFDSTADKDLVLGKYQSASRNKISALSANEDLDVIVSIYAGRKPDSVKI